ncbi:TVP38/TMEM64 family protein [Alkalicoccus halolimnae]|uniref:TVP38/TMEM64 family membrane protein n=1 Tax=Alkalicoccus halolimnae TaxID=1667239 RepID=A0A5C7FIX3_9BACI|nr:VTT domain-containing protein [Alkalicoccus halolimnae]TXF87277.1 VTT domain-containing protein [Alkalicoccus halolimnae]
MGKWLSLIILIVLAAFLVTQWETVSQLRREDVTYFTEVLFPSAGYQLLLLTIPLLIAQNIFTVFPVIIVIIIHFIAYGVLEGFLFSLIGTTLGAVFCFYLARTWSKQKVRRFWENKSRKWKKAAFYIENNGIEAMILLRSIPIMPSNVISVSAALTPMTLPTYLFGTILGNISMIWVLALLSYPLWTDGNFPLLFSVCYGIFLLFLGAYIVSKVSSESRP